MTELPYELPADARQLFREARSVLLATHEHPDADGLGSLAACGLALARLGFEVARLGTAPLPRNLVEFPGLDRLEVDDGRRDYDLAVLFDCRVATRLGDDASALERCSSVLVIDHHPPVADEEPAGHEWIVPTAPATTLLVLALIRRLGGIEVVDADIATNLYAGLVVDTGGFRHPSTTADAMRAGALLMDRGARASEFTELLLHRRRPEAVRLLSGVFSGVRYLAEGRVALLAVPASALESSGADAEEAEGFISIASAIEGVELAAMHLETGPAEWRVSLRARAPYRVDSLARARGGGGHVLAAGYRDFGPLDALQNALAEDLRAELQRPGRQRG